LIFLWVTERLAPGIRVLRWQYRNWRLQGKVQHGFRGQLDLLTMGSRLDAPAQAAAGGGADGRAFASACKGTDQGSDARTRANFFGSVLAARTSLAFVLVGLNVVVIVARLQPVKLQYQLGLSGKLAGALHLDHVAFHGITSGNDHIPIDREGRIEGGMERLALSRSFRIHRIHKAYRQRGA